jgi:hypothetical protein
MRSSMRASTANRSSPREVTGNDRGELDGLTAAFAGRSELCS